MKKTIEKISEKEYRSDIEAIALEIADMLRDYEITPRFRIVDFMVGIKKLLLKNFPYEEHSK